MKALQALRTFATSAATMAQTSSLVLQPDKLAIVEGLSHSSATDGKVQEQADALLATVASGGQACPKLTTAVLNDDVIKQSLAIACGNGTPANRIAALQLLSEPVRGVQTLQAKVQVAAGCKVCPLCPPVAVHSLFAPCCCLSAFDERAQMASALQRLVGVALLLWKQFSAGDAKATESATDSRTAPDALLCVTLHAVASLSASFRPAQADVASNADFVATLLKAMATPRAHSLVLIKSLCCKHPSCALSCCE